jgi:hypothetical protein
MTHSSKRSKRKLLRPDDFPEHCRTYGAFHARYCLRFIYLGILFFIKIQDKNKRHGGPICTRIISFFRV